MRACVHAVLVALLSNVLSADPICSQNRIHCLELVEDPDNESSLERLQVFEMQNGLTQLRNEFTIQPDGRSLMISDDGHRIVFTPYWSQDAVVTIMRDDGHVVRNIKLGDVIAESDFWALMNQPSPAFTLRGDRLLIVGRGGRHFGMSLNNGDVLTQNAILYPVPRPYVTLMNSPSITAWQHTSCDAAFSDAAVKTIKPGMLMDYAFDAPLPDYPRVAFKARIVGTVRVQVVVNERGEVACVRTSNLAFGLSEEVERYVKKWKFRRFRVGGKVLTVTSTFGVVFDLKQ